MNINKGKKKILLWLPAILWLISIFILALRKPPELIPPFPHYDKVMHFGAFGLLSVLFAFPYFFIKYKKIEHIMMVIIVPIIYGAIIEIVQIFAANRKADIYDWIADLTGVIIAFIVISIVLRYANRKH